jgi:hypothetical protein
MNRPISTKAHGVIDYTWSTTAAALPKAMNGATATARLVRNAGYAATLNSMLTNYEAGVMPIMPMKGHLALDVLMCSALIASPLYLPASERRWAAIPVALGIAGLIAGLLTQTRSPREIDDAGFTSARELEA